MIETIKKYSIKAKKSLWQNYLTSEEILDKIANSVEIYDQNVIEIWPWFGALTAKILLKNPKNLTLVELDWNMIDIITRRIQNKEMKIWENTNLVILEQDILKFETYWENYLILANIPYYITSPILYKFLYEVEFFPQKMVIMMQDDVAKKILNPKKSSYLSLYIHKKSQVRSICKVPRKDFYPAPKVDSEVLLFELNDTFSEIDDKKFINLIKIWFKNPRKKLVNNLENWWFDKTEILKIFAKMWIDENIRGEDLGIEVWCKLVKSLKY